MAKLNKTIKVPYSGFESRDQSIDKLIEIGESDEFIDIDCTN